MGSYWDFYNNNLVFRLSPIFAAVGVVLAAIYMLGAYERIFTGPLKNEKNESLKDLSLREKLSIGPLVILMFLFGVYPNALERVINEWVGVYNINFESMSYRYLESISLYIQGLF